MLLGVPVLSRYDLLERLVASAEAGSLVPSAYLIVDNGGGFQAFAESSAAIQAARKRAEIWLLEPRANLGVAASWNAILDRAGDEPVVVSNDDIELGQDTLAVMERALRDDGWALVIADAGYNKNGWCLFAQSKRCTELVGPYDESFHPAYYEDSDYRRRAKLLGIEPFYAKTSFEHEGWATLKADGTGQLNAGQRRSREQFERKWGGLPETEGLFTEPFDGAPIAGYQLRRPFAHRWTKLAPRLYRWDIINDLIRALDAKVYLEIGVSNGDSMRRVAARRKIGVDPNPTAEGARACDVLVPKDSDAFFAQEWSTMADVVFVDGLHHAGQAYRDIENAIAHGAGAVVVHDASPSTEEMQRVPAIQSEWTGDVWKAIARLRAEGRHLVRTVDTDYGVAVVLPDRGSAEWTGSWETLTWADLERDRAQILGLISTEEWPTWLRAHLVVESGEEAPP